tara:strand:+ start:962 stop:1321 length:360 start_codon:yes stop_codon:yes gene_type:complete
MVDFYLHLFQTEIAHKFVNENNEMYGAFIEIGNNTLIEIFNSDLKPNNNETSGFRHICIETNDIKKTQIQINNLSISSEIMRGKSDNTLQLHIQDPDGNKIEFQEIDAKSKIKNYSSFK